MSGLTTRCPRRLRTCRSRGRAGGGCAGRGPDDRLLARRVRVVNGRRPHIRRPQTELARGVCPPGALPQATAGRARRRRAPMRRYFSRLSANTFLIALASLFADTSTEMLYPVLPVFLTADSEEWPGRCGRRTGGTAPYRRPWLRCRKWRLSSTSSRFEQLDGVARRVGNTARARRNALG
jgi:hypothetical protein